MKNGCSGAALTTEVHCYTTLGGVAGRCFADKGDRRVRRFSGLIVHHTWRCPADKGDRRVRCRSVAVRPLLLRLRCSHRTIFRRSTRMLLAGKLSAVHLLHGENGKVPYGYVSGLFGERARRMVAPVPR